MTGGTPDNDCTAAPHRLRDLDRRGKLWAAAFALALLLAPLQAFGHVVSDWVPANDPALIGIQALEVGSAHTPLTGQPSTSAHYVEDERHVDHPGPLHTYLLAVPMRVLGPAVGMLSVSVLLVSTFALLMAWAFYRRLGPTGGVVGASLVSLLMFTTGAATLMVPVSSNMAGYPLYCAAVLLWCVLRGDIRLLPVTTAVTTFAAQQHLSVLPTVAILVPAALAGLAWHWSRGDPSGHERHAGGREDLRQVVRRLRRRGEPPGVGLRRGFPALAQLFGWAGTAVVVGLVLWSPMLAQEVRDDPGNLTSLVQLSRDDGRPTLGTGSAVNQVTHVVGLPPLLGRTDLSANSAGDLLLRRPPGPTTVSAVAMLAVLGLLWGFWRRRAPERQALVTWVGVLLVAGLVNGSSVLDSIEKWRLVLYHWIWPLSLFVTLALVLGALEAVRALASKVRTSPVAGLTHAGATRPVLVSVALLAVVVPAVVNPTLDRPSNDLSMFRSGIQRRYIDEVVQQVLAQDDRLEEPVLVLGLGELNFTGAAEPLALYLRDAGIDVRLPERARYFVSDRRVVEDDHPGPGLLVVHDQHPDWHEIDRGTLVADVTTVDDIDFDAYDAAVTALEAADTLDFGPDIRGSLEFAPDHWVDAAQEGALERAELDPETITSGEFSDRAVLQLLDALAANPAESLWHPELLDFLLDHPLDHPTLDPELLRELRATNLSDQSEGRPIRIRVYRLENHELTHVDLD